MSYYTQYELSICSSNFEDFDKEPEIVTELLKCDVFKYDTCVYKSFYDLLGNNEMKWYNHEKDLLEVSKKFPSILLCLRGEGEDREDIWNKYFKNGKVFTYYAEFIPPKELDPNNPNDMKLFE